VADESHATTLLLRKVPRKQTRRPVPLTNVMGGDTANTFELTKVAPTAGTRNLKLMRVAAAILINVVRFCASCASCVPFLNAVIDRAYNGVYSRACHLHDVMS
jgi:hypothetical protein